MVIPAWVRETLMLRPGDELVVTLEPRLGRALVLRAAAAADIERALEKGAAWFRETGRDLVEELHEARRQATQREGARRRP